MKTFPGVLKLAIAATLATSWAPQAGAIVLDGELDPGGVIEDGHGDIYDQGGRFWINGVRYMGTVSGSDPVYQVATQNVGGIDVTGQVSGFDALGLDSGATDFRIVRWWFTLKNSTDANAPVLVEFGVNMGSDSGSVVTGKSLSPLRWIITADDPSNPNDPVAGHVCASREVPVPSPALVGLLVEDVGCRASFSIAPGKTVSLVFFALARNVTGSQGDGESTTGDILADINNVLLDTNQNVKSTFLAGGLAPPTNAVNQSTGVTNTRILKKSVRVRHLASGKVVVKGKAKSDFDIAKVEFSVGKLTGKAKGKARWRFKAPAVGPIKVQAVDQLGGVSDTVSIK